MQGKDDGDERTGTKGGKEQGGKDEDSGKQLVADLVDALSDFGVSLSPPLSCLYLISSIRAIPELVVRLCGYCGYALCPCHCLQHRRV